MRAIEKYEEKSKHEVALDSPPPTPPRGVSAIPPEITLKKPMRTSYPVPAPRRGCDSSPSALTRREATSAPPPRQRSSSTGGRLDDEPTAPTTPPRVPPRGPKYVRNESSPSILSAIPPPRPRIQRRPRTPPASFSDSGSSTVRSLSPVGAGNKSVRFNPDTSGSVAPPPRDTGSPPPTSAITKSILRDKLCERIRQEHQRQMGSTSKHHQEIASLEEEIDSLLYGRSSLGQYIFAILLSLVQLAVVWFSCRRPTVFLKSYVNTNTT